MDKSKLAVETYEKIASKYAQQYFDDMVDVPYIDKFLTKLPKQAKILDVGSGPGQFANYMTGKGFEVIGIDFSKEMITIAKGKVSNVDFRQMDIRQLSFPDGYFDGIFAAYSLIHIPSEEIPQHCKGFIGFSKLVVLSRLPYKRVRLTRSLTSHLCLPKKCFSTSLPKIGSPNT